MKRAARDRQDRSQPLCAAPLELPGQAGRTKPARADEASEAVVPVVAEQLHVGKRKVETGRVRIRKVLREEQQTIDLPLLREEVVAERVPINRVVESVPPARREGDTWVLPVVEEVLVVNKRLMLVEEIRVRRRTTTVRRPERVTVRREEARIERLRPERASEP